MSRLSRIVSAVLLLSTMLSASVRASAAPDGTAPELAVPDSVGIAPGAESSLYFIENRGQVDGPVAYYVQGGNTVLYFNSAGLTLVLSEPTATDREPRQSWVLKLDFVGAIPDVQPVGRDETPTLISYFTGPASEWKTGLRTYAKLLYADLWPGIDLLFLGTSQELKYQFTVHPGADPHQIRLAWRGASSVAINEAGQLEICTPLGDVRDDRPFAYQEMDGKRVEVPAVYRTFEAAQAPEIHHYGFGVGSYDPARQLVIDPSMVAYCGYIGGSGDEDVGHGWGAIAVDEAGNAYVAGGATSDPTTFPLLVGPYLASECAGFVAKVKADGSGLLYCGYLGAVPYGIAVDSGGNAYLTGDTHGNLPATVGPDLTYNGQFDAFVMKVNPSGTTVLYYGYVGGTGQDEPYGIEVDAAGNAYITGWTMSPDFPTTEGWPYTTFTDDPNDANAFIAKVNADGTGLEYSGRLGGVNWDHANAIAVDSQGCAYVTGFTMSSPEDGFPVMVGPDQTLEGPYGGFIAKVNSSGSGLAYCGYLDRQYYNIAVDGSGCAYVGQPAYAPGDSIVKVKANGSGLEWVYSAFSGDVAVDSTGSLYVVGTTSLDQGSLPVTVGPDLDYNGGPCDGFVAKLKPDGSGPEFCGYIGGSGADWAYGIALDPYGNVYIQGVTESDQSTFPVAVGPDLTFNGGLDMFVMKLGQANSPPTVEAGGPYVVNEGGEVIVTASGSDPGGGPLTFAWDLDHDGTFETPGQSATVLAAGLDGPSTHTIAVQVTDTGGLTATDDATVTVLNVAPTAGLSNDGPVDEGSSATITFSGQYDPSSADAGAGFHYAYDCDGGSLAGDAYDNSGSETMVTCPYNDGPSTHTVVARIIDKDDGFTEYTTEVTVNNVPPEAGQASAPEEPAQASSTVEMSVHFTDPGAPDTLTAVFDWGDGSTSPGTITPGGSWVVSGSHVYAGPGVYTVKLTVTDKDGGATEVVFPYVVIYDPSAGFVTGGGWISSPAGAYTPDPALVGKASFGFVSRYQKGATIPTGNTEFQFKAGGLHFHSEAYEWLVIAGARAKYKGTGTINGAGNYGFMLTAIDGAMPGGGGADKFRIKIWDKANGDGIVYDNQHGAADDADPTTVIGGGSIVIHKEK